MKLGYVATLEFNRAAPETVRGDFEVANARLGARRVVERLFKTHPNRQWSSLVVVLTKPTQEVCE